MITQVTSGLLFPACREAVDSSFLGLGRCLVPSIHYIFQKNIYSEVGTVSCRPEDWGWVLKDVRAGLGYQLCAELPCQAGLY